MKATNLVARLHLTRFAGPPDEMNWTTLHVNGQKIWPCGDEAFDTYTIAEGDEIVLDIPSGGLAGVVEVIYQFKEDFGALGITDSLTVTLHAEWEGRAGGLAGGLSGICNFDVQNAYLFDQEDPALVVESSAIDHPVPLGIYEAVRELARVSPDREEEKPLVMRRLFRALGI